MTKKRGCGCNRRAAALKRTSRKEKKPTTLVEKYKLNTSETWRAPHTPDSELIVTQYGMVNTADYQEALDQWLDTPYRHMGQTRDGTDCIGLVLGLYKELGLLPEDLSPDEYAKQWYLTESYTHHPAFEKLKETVDLKKIDEPSELRAGDILVFSFGKGIESHVGVLTKRGTIMHSVAGDQANKVIESRFEDNRWRKRFVYAYRLTNGARKEQEGDGS